MRAAELRKQCSMAPRGRSAAETVRGAVDGACETRCDKRVEIAVYVVRVTISSRERGGSRARGAASRGPALWGIRYPS